MQTGNIGVTTENIFPVIKKFLYSDEEIFIREIISNAVDAIQKLKTLAASGEYNGDVENLQVDVFVNTNDNTITVRDNGIGMTGEEIDKYINQIAFSGAEEFINKFKADDNNIIGHFGLGFYSSYIVSKTVEILTKSYKEGAVAQHWVCDGTPAFTLEDTVKEHIGTDIIMHISDEFIGTYVNYEKIKELLNKYSKFLPVKIFVHGPAVEDTDASTGETTVTHPEPEYINSVEPLWIKKPSEITDEEYLHFYQVMYPGQPAPLFWVHLNVDFPFHLTGILYFPYVTGNVDIMRNKVYLYCNQVYVTDHVNNILPDYLTLLHGVIDSPDIPLNVSRSYLQSDSNVKQIAGYISNKVAAELVSRVKADRKAYEDKWSTMKIFLQYGALTQDGFYKKVKDALLVIDTEGKYYTVQELIDEIKDTQVNKEGKTVVLYAVDPNAQYTYVEDAKALGYKVIVMNDNLTTPLINLYERENDNVVWVRVDSDIISNLIEKKNDSSDSDECTDDAEAAVLSESDKNILTSIFTSELPTMNDCRFNVNVCNLGASTYPIRLTANEWSRRIKELYASQPNAAVFGNFNYSFTFNVNADADIIKNILNKFNTKHGAKYADMLTKIEAQQKIVSDLEAASAPKAESEEVPTENTEDLVKPEKDKLLKLIDDRNELVKKFANKSNLVHELLDIALLQVGMLSGEKLNNFINCTLKLLK